MRGGPRTGRLGKNYTNRTDLNPAAPKALPPTAVPNQQYGQAKAQIDAQKVAPMANGPLASPIVPQLGQPQGASSTSPGQSQSVPLTSLFAPTQKPNEPVTAGVANSPGPGPDALNIPDPVANQYQSAKAQIQQMAQDANASPALQFLAQRINGAY